jgi:hypothetical protein
VSQETTERMAASVSLEERLAIAAQALEETPQSSALARRFCDGLAADIRAILLSSAEAAAAVATKQRGFDSLREILKPDATKHEDLWIVAERLVRELANWRSLPAAMRDHGILVGDYPVSVGAAIALMKQQLEDLVRTVNARNVLTCVYCGEAYPPGSPTHGAEVLTAHIRVCAKHPLRAAEARERVLHEALAEALSWVPVLNENRIRERVALLAPAPPPLRDVMEGERS